MKRIDGKVRGAATLRRTSDTDERLALYGELVQSAISRTLQTISRIDLNGEPIPKDELLREIADEIGRKLHGTGK